MTDVPAQLNAIADQLDTAAGVIANVASDVTASAASLRTAAAMWDPSGTIAQLEADLADAQQAIADLQADLAAAQTELQVVTDERDVALVQIVALNTTINNLEAQIAQLEADLAACQGGDEPDPMVSGPAGLPAGNLIPAGSVHDNPPQLDGYYTAGPGATIGVTRGAAIVDALDQDTLRVHLDIATAGTTPTHEQHFHLNPVHTVTMETRRRINGALHDTGKIGGAGGFDGNWAEWPGGGTKGPANWMVRSCWWHYDRGVGTARLTNLVKLGGPYAADMHLVDGQGGVGANLGAPPRWLSSEDWVAELYLHDAGDLALHIGEWITVRHVASTGGNPTAPIGWLDTYVQYDGGPWQLVQALGGIRWAETLRDDGAGEGFNRGYLSLMQWRRDAGIDSTVDLAGVRIWPGEVRPI